MNDQVETVVEQHNANQEALGATLARQRDTSRRLDDARKRLGSAQVVMAERVRAIYMGGAVTGLEQLLEVRTVTDAVTVSQFQQSANAADAKSISDVSQLRFELSSISASLDAQRREQQRLKASLDTQRHDIDRKLADQRAFLDRLDAGVRQAVTQEQQRQEDQRNQAMANELAAARAAREQAAKPKATSSTAGSTSSSTPGTTSGSSTSSSTSGTTSTSRRSVSSTSGSTTTSTTRHHRTPAPARSSSSSSPSRPSSSSSAPSSLGGKAVAFARAQLGRPYIWGGVGPTGYDCSGLTMKAWQSAGVSIPRLASRQYANGRHVSRSELAAGDLVFFGHPIHHVGMYIGSGQMIEAPFTGAQIRVHSMNRSDYFGATRPTG